MPQHAARTPTNFSKASRAVIRDHLPEPSAQRDQAIQNALRILVGYQLVHPAQADDKTPNERVSSSPK